MLRPTKHSHPDKTLFHVAYLLLKYLKKRRVEKFCTLLNFAKKEVKGGDILFMPALNFLYILGLIEYRPKNDVVEYIGSDEAI